MNHQYDFANILFAGPCNLRCPYCIGRQVNPALNRPNLNEFPLKNLDQFVAMVRHYQVTEIVFTGTTTDPQLYRHEARLLAWLREQLPPDPLPERGQKQVQYSLHTNGQLALRKMDVFNQYDRVCISFPSFNADTYHKLMGSPKVPDLAEIVRQAQVPLKISCVINEHTISELDEFLDQCGAIGIKRLVLRQLYGDTRQWPLPAKLSFKSIYRHNPVYNYAGMEITYWRFEQTASTSINLFSDGTISSAYLLTQAQPVDSRQ